MVNLFYECIIYISGGIHNLLQRLKSRQLANLSLYKVFDSVKPKFVLIAVTSKMWIEAFSLVLCTMFLIP